MHPIKALLFLAGGVGAAGATAVVVTGVDPLSFFRAPEIVSAVPEATTVTKTDRAGEAATPVADDREAVSKDAAPVIAPTFGLVRVEPDGSLVVAGSAASSSHVELVAGAKMLGDTKADGSGDFAIVLDNPLEPGDYQLVLRSTAQDGTVATSIETAIVSVPDTKDGQVLALVEQAGEPSRLITKPVSEAKPQAAVVSEPSGGEEDVAPDAKEIPAAVAESADVAPVEVPATKEEVETAEALEPDEQVKVASVPSEPAAAVADPKASETPSVFVEAVEIEGRQIFVAGTAEPNMRVRVYANEFLLGDSAVDEGGRFLVETERDLPVGDYIIRADLLDKAGSEVVARAAVPFERRAGTSVAAVAPAASEATTESVSPATESVDDEVVEVPPTTAESGGQQVPSTAPTVEDADKPSTATAVSSADTVEAVVSAKLEPAPAAVIIRRGDTLWQISRRVYGRGVRYSTIYTANQHQIEDPHRIWPGQIFEVPHKVHDGEAPDFSQIEAPPAMEKPDTATQ